MNRKTFITSLGATCKNWTWSWSFVNEAERFIVFGEWDVYAQENESLIFSRKWQTSAKHRRNPGYTESLEHLDLIENQGYRLFTFPMELDRENRADNAPPVIKSIIPQLEGKQLVQRDNQWFAIALASEAGSKISAFISNITFIASSRTSANTMGGNFDLSKIPASHSSGRATKRPSTPSPKNASKLLLGGTTSLGPVRFSGASSKLLKSGPQQINPGTTS